MGIALFAGIRVRDMATARAWYERLLGQPSFFPNANEVVWTLADGRSLYIQDDPRRAGGALITVFVDDLDAVISEIGSRGLEPAERETYSNGVRKATYRDDDGNEMDSGARPATIDPGSATREARALFVLRHRRAPGGARRAPVAMLPRRRGRVPTPPS